MKTKRTHWMVLALLALIALLSYLPPLPSKKAGPQHIQAVNNNIAPVFVMK